MDGEGLRCGKCAARRTVDRRPRGAKEHTLATGLPSQALMRPLDCPSPFIIDTGYHGLPGPDRQYK